MKCHVILECPVPDIAHEMPFDSEVSCTWYWHEMPPDPEVSCTWYWHEMPPDPEVSCTWYWHEMPSDPEVSCTWYCAWNAIWSWSVLYLILRWNVMWSLTVMYLGFYMKCHMTINCQVPGILHEMPHDHKLSGTWDSTWNATWSLSVKYLVFSTIIYLKFYLQYHISFIHEMNSLYGIITTFQPQILQQEIQLFV